jgi:hypothetical protein
MATDMTIAHEINRQIGNGAFLMMGTKNKIGDTNSLKFDIKLCKQYNWIKITLDANDTYTVEFIKVGRAPTIDPVHDVYVEDLHNLISKRTGLALRIPRIIGINA